MTTEKKDPYDHTATQRNARRAERNRIEGGRRLNGWIDKQHNDMLEHLLEQGYAKDITAVVAKAITEAYEKFNKK